VLAICIDKAKPFLGECMSESKSQSTRSLAKAQAVLREQWPEVLQYVGDRSNPTSNLRQASPNKALDAHEP
jgi:hypothetical protein